MDVSIIIVNYNTDKLILDCLDSIYEKTEGILYEVIVVDNNSPIEPKILKKDKRIRYIQSQSNLGFGKACNLGAKYANGNLLFFLNPDTLLINNAVKIIYECMNDFNIGICGGNLFSEDMHYAHSFYKIMPGIIYELITLLKLDFLNFQFNKSDNIIDVGYVTGADLMIRKEIFNTVGGFDKDFFMYFEETFLCYKVKSLGYRIINVPQAQIIHLEGKSFSLNKNREKMYFEGRKLYLIKRHNKVYYFICNLILGITCISRLFLFFYNKNKRFYWSYKLRLLF